jgi:hypothetical protein
MSRILKRLWRSGLGRYVGTVRRAERESDLPHAVGFVRRLPWPKLCSRLSPLVLRTLKVSFSIFQRARPAAASSGTVSAVIGRSVTKLL